MVNPVQIQFADGLSRTEYTYFMQATMYTSIDQKNSWIYKVGEIKYCRNKAFSTVHFFVLHFCLEKSKLTKGLQVHLNKLECRGKVHLFQ